MRSDTAWVDWAKSRPYRALDVSLRELFEGSFRTSFPCPVCRFDLDPNPNPVFSTPNIKAQVFYVKEGEQVNRLVIYTESESRLRQVWLNYYPPLDALFCFSCGRLTNFPEMVKPHKEWA